MKSGFHFILLVHQALSHSLYQKGLPKTLTFFTDNAIKNERLYLYNKNSPMECSLKWMDNPSRPAAFTFDNKTQSCQGYDRVYGLTNEVNGQEAFMLCSYENEGCNDKSVLEEYKNITVCMPGWFPVRAEDNSGYCYQMIELKNLDGHHFIDECKENYPYAQAASIHSDEEAVEIGPKESFFINIGLVLVPDKMEWKWLDGSAFGFSKLVSPAELKAKCEELMAVGHSTCMHGGMYWDWEGTTEKPKNIRWNMGYTVGHVLCKYKMY